ncbi:hypothetical protein CKO44_25035 [Rubrivivax gelatinosus]|nr:hypothetical protein [Rubrivivax gelatinosus]
MNAAAPGADHISHSASVEFCRSAHALTPALSREREREEEEARAGITAVRRGDRPSSQARPA